MTALDPAPEPEDSGPLHGDSIVVLGKIDPTGGPPSGLAQISAADPISGAAPAAPTSSEMVFAKSSAAIDWDAKKPSNRPPPASGTGGAASVTNLSARDVEIVDPASTSIEELLVAQPDQTEHDDGDDDAFLDDGHTRRSTGVGPAWLESATEEEPRPSVKRMSGQSVALALIAVTITFAALALYVRYAYRGDHDTAKDLGLPLRDAAVAAASAEPGLPSTAVTAPTSTTTTTAVDTAATTATAPPASAALVATNPVSTGDPPVVATAPIATNGGSAVAPALTTHPVTSAALPPASASAATSAAAPIVDAGPIGVDAAAAAAAEGFTAAAQKALEKEGNAGAASRAAELAWKATKRDPSNAEAWLTLGAAYGSLGNRAQAMQAYRSCAKQASGPKVAECRSLAGLPAE